MRKLSSLNGAVRGYKEILNGAVRGLNGAQMGQLYGVDPGITALILSC